MNKMSKKKVDIKRFEELLDSDDELPMEYNEAPTIPAYQMDSRFDMIQFKWINNVNTFDSHKQCNTEASSIATNSLPSVNEYPITNNNNNNKVKPVLYRGVLNKEDLFCLKSIEGYTGDSTLIWLINFLLHKDLQSGYMYLRSCLVSNNFKNESVECKLNKSSETKKVYSIAVKI